MVQENSQRHKLPQVSLTRPFNQVHLGSGPLLRSLRKLKEGVHCRVASVDNSSLLHSDQPI